MDFVEKVLRLTRNFDSVDVNPSRGDFAVWSIGG
jgi:hypothetical protein